MHYHYDPSISGAVKCVSGVIFFHTSADDRGLSHNLLTLAHRSSSKDVGISKAEVDLELRSS